MARMFARGRVAKPYCEAFPCLKLAEVIAEWSAGSRTCEWTNEHGIIVGHVALVAVTPESVTFDYLFFGAVNVAAGAGRDTIDLQPSNEGGARRKPAFLCPVSRRPVGCVYYVDHHWAGKISHGLVHLSQRLDRVTKVALHSQKLRRRANLGRYAFKSLIEFVNVRREIAELEAVLEGHGISKLPTRLSYRAVPRWLSTGEVPKTAVSDKDEGYGWKPGQARGFERFYVGRVTPASERNRADYS